MHLYAYMCISLAPLFLVLLICILVVLCMKARVHKCWYLYIVLAVSSSHVARFPLLYLNLAVVSRWICLGASRSE